MSELEDATRELERRVAEADERASGGAAEAEGEMERVKAKAKEAELLTQFRNPVVVEAAKAA